MLPSSLETEIVKDRLPKIFKAVFMELASLYPLVRVTVAVEKFG
jgi:hypothetical protein